MVAILLVVSFLVFCLLSLAPGDPAVILLGGPSKATPEAVAKVRAAYHLDDPLLAQYWYWLQDVLRFDFGRSIRSQLPVIDAIRERFPITAALAVYSFIITIVIAIPLGLAAGVRREASSASPHLCLHWRCYSSTCSPCNSGGSRCTALARERSTASTT